MHSCAPMMTMAKLWKIFVTHVGRTGWKRHNLRRKLSLGFSTNRRRRHASTDHTCAGAVKNMEIMAMRLRLSLGSWTYRSMLTMPTHNTNSGNMTKRDRYPIPNRMEQTMRETKTKVTAVELCAAPVTRLNGQNVAKELAGNWIWPDHATPGPKV